jgi:hypothetical protein
LCTYAVVSLYLSLWGTLPCGAVIHELREFNLSETGKKIPAHRKENYTCVRREKNFLGT